MHLEIEKFIIKLHKEKDISENTELSYRRDLKKLLDYLENKGIDDFEQINESDLVGYVEYLHKLGRKSSTITRSIVSIKSFFNYLFDEGLVEKNYALKLVAPKIEKHAPNVLTLNQVDALLSAPSGDTPKELRDKAMLELLYATGMRVTEIITLELKDVNLELEYVVCHDRTKERMIPFGSDAKKALVMYLRNGRDYLLGDNESDCLFLNCSGKTMSRQGFWKIIKQYGNKAEIDMEITPHVLRHTFATHLINNGAALKSVQVMLGHSDVSTTHMYLNAENRKIREAYDRAHPKA